MVDMTTYHAHLRSHRWFALRLRVLVRSGGICERCGERAMVDVHHLTYRRLGHERMGDVLGVCRPCHRELHGLL